MINLNKCIYINKLNGVECFALLQWLMVSMEIVTYCKSAMQTDRDTVSLFHFHSLHKTCIPGIEYLTLSYLCFQLNELSVFFLN